MHWKEFYFSFEGQVNRFDFTFKFYLPMILGFIAVNWLQPNGMDELASLYMLVVLVPYLALISKRFHDFGKSTSFAIAVYGLGGPLVASIPVSLMFFLPSDMFPNLDDVLVYIGITMVLLLIWALIPVVIPGMKGDKS
ncbi:DUF805 domain-containing protein [Alphaproteobacteria bacterium]|nr:DUF805 domain-containing protein [Alphaproteobacteria bacterium]